MVDYFRIATRFFAQPNPAAARMGDGYSSQGLGFYITTDVGETAKTLASNRGLKQDKIIYKIGIAPDAVIADGLKPVDRDFFDRAVALARINNMEAFADDLRASIDASPRMPFAQFEHVIGSHFLKPGHVREKSGRAGFSAIDQRKQNAFLLELGISGVKQLDDARMIDYNAIDTLSIEQVIGHPEGMPKHVGPGTTVYKRDGQKPYASYNARVTNYVLRSTIASENLSSAWTDLQQSAPDVAEKFRPLLDDLHLQPSMATPGFNGGFPCREAMGAAIQKALRGETGRETHSVGSTPHNVIQNLTDLGLEDHDPRLLNYLDRFCRTELMPLAEKRAAEKLEPPQAGSPHRQGAPKGFRK